MARAVAQPFFEKIWSPERYLETYSIQMRHAGMTHTSVPSEERSLIFYYSNNGVVLDSSINIVLSSFNKKGPEEICDLIVAEGIKKTMAGSL
jgi:hypothetical protein